MSAFSVTRDVLSLGELAERSQLPKSTARRLALQLVQTGALEQNHDGTYSIGARLWAIGHMSPAHRRMQAAAAPLASNLSAATRCGIHIAVLDGVTARVIDSIGVPRAPDATDRFGASLPLHASSAGKVIIAFTGIELFDRVVAEGLPRWTPRTITEPAHLARSLRETRRTKLGWSVEEMTPGMSSVAAPIISARSGLRGAISMSSRSATDLGAVANDLARVAVHIGRRFDEHSELAAG